MRTFVIVTLDVPRLAMRNAVTLSGVPDGRRIRPVLRMHEQRRRATRTPQRQGEHDRHDRDHERSGDHREAHTPPGDAHARHIRGCGDMFGTHATRLRALKRCGKPQKRAPGPRTLSGRFADVARRARGCPGQSVARRRLGCGRATDERRVAGSPPRRAGAPPRAAAGCSRRARRRLWREPRRPLRQRHDGSRRGACRGRNGRRPARRDGAAAAGARSGVRGHAPVARRGERALHAARALRGCGGPARDRDRARPRARSADRVARQSHVPRPVARGPALRRRHAA